MEEDKAKKNEGKKDSWLPLSLTSYDNKTDKYLLGLRNSQFEMEMTKHNDAISAERKGLIGNGDRSDKIRT
jgi:protein subunit release factor A